MVGSKSSFPFVRTQAEELARRLAEPRRDRVYWGRLAESAVGAHLANAAAAGTCELCYWCDRNREVDFVIRAGKKLVAIGVKSGRRRDHLPGMTVFSGAFQPTR